MAAPTFFELFDALWAETGTVGDISLAQYKAGWAFIGSIPPSVEQFNLAQQLADQKVAWLFQQVKSVADATGQTMDANTLDILLKAFENLDMDKAKKGTLAAIRGGTGVSAVGDGQILVGNAQGGYTLKAPKEVRELLAAPKIVSITALPTTDIGPVVVAECGEVWIWSQSAYFTGYRSPLCGRPVDGHTLAPLASEVDGIGGLLPKVAYARLWGYAQENGRVVTQAFWDANKGGHYFVDVDANTFRAPDLRDMFRRFTGTDADTANARTLGSRQLHNFGSHTHGLTLQRSALGTSTNMPTVNNGNNTHPFNANGQPDLYVLRSDISASIGASGGTETRSVNTAYYPRIHA